MVVKFNERRIYIWSVGSNLGGYSTSIYNSVESYR